MSDLDLLFSQALAASDNLYEEKERVAIVGSRKYPDLEKVRAYVMALPTNVVIVTGGAEGVDKMTEETARLRGLDVEIYLPDWSQGKKAGPLRNQQIVANADRVVAFWNGQSRGTKNSIELAQKRGIPVEINPEIATPFDRKKMIHFEQSRAGGVFSCYNVSTWSPGRVAIFKRWKDDPTSNPALVEEIAQEIVQHLRALFGGTPPPMLITKPPRGKTPESAIHAIAVLAEAVARKLSATYLECVARNEPDSTAHLGRSRIQNLRDTSTFRLTQELSPDKLILALDDVSTTGRTLERMRAALHGLPHLLFAYVIWH